MYDAGYFRQVGRQAAAVKQPAEVGDGVRDALQKDGFAFVEPAQAVGPHGLKDAQEDKTVKIGFEVTAGGVRIGLCRARYIVLQQLFAQRGR